MKCKNHNSYTDYTFQAVEYDGNWATGLAKKKPRIKSNEGRGNTAFWDHSKSWK